MGRSSACSKSQNIAFGHAAIFAGALNLIHIDAGLSDMLFNCGAQRFVRSRSSSTRSSGGRSGF